MGPKEEIYKEQTVRKIMMNAGDGCQGRHDKVEGRPSWDGEEDAVGMRENVRHASIDGLWSLNHQIQCMEHIISSPKVYDLFPFETSSDAIKLLKVSPKFY